MMRAPERLLVLATCAPAVRPRRSSARPPSPAASDRRRAARNRGPLQEADAPVGLSLRRAARTQPAVPPSDHDDVETHAGSIRRRCTLHRWSALDVFSPATRSWFERAFDGADARPALGWPAIARGGHVLIQAPTGSGKTLAAFLLGDRPAERDARAGLRLLYVSPLKALNYDIERNLRSPLAGLELEAPGRGPHGRHAGRGAPADAADAARHPHHDARVALPAPDVAGARDAARDRDRDPRRGARGRRDEARRAPRALARAPRAARGRSRSSGSGCRRRSGRSRRSAGSSRARVARSSSSTPASRKELDLEVVVPVEDMRELGSTARALRAAARRRGGDGRRRRALEPLDLALDLPGDPRARARSTARRSSSSTTAGSPSGSRSASTSSPSEELARAHHGSLAREQRVVVEELLKAGRIPCLVATSSLELGIDMGAVDLVDPGREPEVGRARPAARRPRRARPALGLEGPHLPEVPGGPPRVGGRRARDARGRDRGDAHPAEPARRPRAADRRDLRRRGGDGGRAPRARPPRVPVRRALARAARERPRHARGPLPVRRVRRAAAADRLGPDRRERCAGARARAGSPSRTPGRSPTAASSACSSSDGGGRVGRARRGDGVRGSRGPDVRARRVDLAHRGDHARPRARLAGARRARASRRSGRARASAARPSSARRSAAPRASCRSRRRGGDRGVRRANTGSTRCAARNLVTFLREQEAATGVVPSDRTLVVERFRDEIGDWRVCILTPFGGRVHAPWAMALARASARLARPRRAVALVGRRHRAALPRLRRGAAARRPPARARRDRGARPRRARAVRALRRALPRERGARAAHPAPPARASGRRSGSSG